MLARRLAGLLVALVLVAGLPLAAARASCVCDHGHQHGATAAAAAPHDCTAACTAATCPMHRRASSAHHGSQPATRDAMSCSCAGDAMALVGQASITAVLPAIAAVATPSADVPAAALPADAPPSLQPTPPAPPPRA